MKRIKTYAAITALLFVFSPGWVLSESAPEAEDIEAREILERTVERNYQDMELAIHLVKVSRKGRERSMDLVVRSKRTDEVTKSLAEFTAPAELVGMKSLSWDYSEPKKPSDRWFLLAGMDKYVKCKGKACSKMGEQFGFSAETFAMDLDDSEHELLGTENIGGAECHKIQSKAKEPDKHDITRLVIWVDKDKLAARKIEAYGKDGKLSYTSTFTEFKQLTDRWWETKGEIVKVKSGKKMRFQIGEAKIDTGIPDEVFAKPKKFAVKENKNP